MAKNLKLGELLKNAGIIDDFQLNSALSYQRHWGGRFGESLIKLGYLTEARLQDFLARQFELPQIELDNRRIPDDVLAYIPEAKAREFQVIPVERHESGGTVHLIVAMTDPTNLMMIDSLQFLTGCRIKPALASAEDIARAIARNYHLVEEEQEELDLTPEDLAGPGAGYVKPDPGEVPSTLPGLKRLEERYENLVRVLLDRGILLPRDLDELM